MAFKVHYNKSFNYHLENYSKYMYIHCRIYKIYDINNNNYIYQIITLRLYVLMYII